MIIMDGRRRKLGEMGEGTSSSSSTCVELRRIHKWFVSSQQFSRHMVLWYSSATCRSFFFGSEFHPSLEARLAFIMRFGALNFVPRASGSLD